MSLRNALRTTARCTRRISLFSLLAFLPLFASSCMVWPGLTAVLVQRPDEKPSSLPLLLALLSGTASVPCWQTGECRIFLTSGFWTPNPGGLTSADNFCQSAASGLSLLGTYKAMLMTEDLARDITHNWVMYPNVVYRTASNGNAIVGTTNAQGIFTFPLTSAIRTSGQAWTGATTAWGVNTGSTCTNWTSNLPGGAFPGSASATSSNMLNFLSDSNACQTSSYNLYCVQQ